MVDSHIRVSVDMCVVRSQPKRPIDEIEDQRPSQAATSNKRLVRCSNGRFVAFMHAAHELTSCHLQSAQVVARLLILRDSTMAIRVMMLK